jgi:host factor-I protein
LRLVRFGNSRHPSGKGLSEMSKDAKKDVRKDINLQDAFLNQARKEHIPVTIYITNGFQFKGIVKGFDNYTVILDTDGKQSLIYKHAVSTITPLKSVSVLDVNNDKNNE